VGHLDLKPRLPDQFEDKIVQPGFYYLLFACTAGAVNYSGLYYHQQSIQLVLEVHTTDSNISQARYTRLRGIWEGL
jgi:hypothetical protein